MYQRRKGLASYKTYVVAGAVAGATVSPVMGIIPITTIVRPTRMSGPTITVTLTHILDTAGRVSSIASLNIIPIEEGRAIGSTNSAAQDSLEQVL